MFCVCMCVRAHACIGSVCSTFLQIYWHAVARNIQSGFQVPEVCGGCNPAGAVKLNF